MKSQFFTAFPAQSSNDEEMKTVSSQGSLDSNNEFACLACKSQEPTPEDFGDALIDNISQQAGNSNKGKGPASQWLL